MYDLAQSKAENAKVFQIKLYSKPYMIYSISDQTMYLYRHVNQVSAAYSLEPALHNANEITNFKTGYKIYRFSDKNV